MEGITIPLSSWKEAPEEVRADALVNHIFKGGVFIIEQGNEVIILPLERF